jgi:bifunctional non-homologous end joining protein LigD
MKAVTGELPAGADWAFEVKWDGIRAIATLAGASMRLWSTNTIDMTVRFPELRPLSSSLGGVAAVLDGEIGARAACRSPRSRRSGRSRRR